ncbi:hypothetical protein BASA81_007490 [Batrachochytrium salamandrivorans]|nr:hypothetical protein BASA81_007490 [Batrachochytrium salamandrivorans]
MSNDQVEFSTPIPPAEEMIAEYIGFLKEAFEETIVKKQETKDKAEGRWTGLYRLIVDLFSNGPDEPDNAPEELIKSSREAPSPLMTEIYTSHIENVAEIKPLVEQIVEDTVERERGTDGCRVIQKAAIQRSRGYLKDLTDISEGMAKTLGIIPKKSRFKGRSRLFKLVFKTYNFNANIKDALLRNRQKHITSGKGRKGREDLVTSKEKLDDQKKVLHRTAILEEDEEEEEDENEKEDDEEEYEEYEDEEQDDKDGAVYEQSDQK